MGEKFPENPKKLKFVATDFSVAVTTWTFVTDGPKVTEFRCRLKLEHVNIELVKYND